ncbi:MAG: hypothetical protein JST54_34625 [Deltaproteobacteria bacterium]|nr:hypothetical protein [Deltaproteobacteria bacterium]
MSELAEAAKTLSVKQQRVLEVLLVGGTDAQAAETAGVHKNTVYNLRYNNEAFIAAMQAARNDLLTRDTSRGYPPTALAVARTELPSSRSSRTRIRRHVRAFIGSLLP